MTVSFVLATYGRRDCIYRFLDSLRYSEYRDFHVVVVDQNDIPRHDLVEIYSKWMDIEIVRSRPGLSRARNIGLGYVRGNIVAFPDDDCWYSTDLLSKVVDSMKSDAVDGVAGICTDEHGRISSGSPDRLAGPITKRNAWRRGVSATIFIKSRVVKVVGGFDENLGAGTETIFQSSEETDYVLRGIAAGFRFQYDPSLVVYHPLASHDADSGAVGKARIYGQGWGRVLRLHGYSRFEVAHHILKPLIGAFSALICGRPDLMRVRYARASGRYVGWKTPLGTVVKARR